MAYTIESSYMGLARPPRKIHICDFFLANFLSRFDITDLARNPNPIIDYSCRYDA